MRPLGLVGSVGLGLGLLTSLGLRLRVRVSVSNGGGCDKPCLPPQQSFSMLLWRHLPPQKHRAAPCMGSVQQSAGIVFPVEICCFVKGWGQFRNTIADDAVNRRKQTLCVN